MFTLKASLWRLGGQKFKHQIFSKFLRYDLFRYTSELLFRTNPHIFLMKFRFYIFYINLVLQRRSIHLYNGHDNRALIMPWSRLLINDFLKIIHDEQNWSVYFKNAYLKSLKLPVIVKRHLYTLIEILLRQC